MDDATEKQYTYKLRDEIVKQFGSVRGFAIKNGLPPTTLSSAISRGNIGSMAFDKVVAICNILHIDVETFEPIRENNKKEEVEKKVVYELTLSYKEDRLLKNFKQLNDDYKIKLLELSEILLNSQNYQQ